MKAYYPFNEGTGNSTTDQQSAHINNGTLINGPAWIGGAPALSGTTGVNTTTLTVVDDNGNASTCNANVTVVDNLPPVTPTLSDINVGECSGTPTAPTTTDNCAATITGTTTTVFPITTQGTTVVTWTFDDGNGNSTTADQNVIVDDVTDPVTPALADVTGECDATATAPTTTDTHILR